MTEATPPELSITSRQRTLILIGTLVGMLVAAISQTIVTTVLPDIALDLDGLGLYTWVFTGSMLASAVATPVFGKMSDLYGRRRLYIAGVSVFLVGAIVCAVAQSMEVLIAGRVVQGIGMGAIMPLAMAIIADVVPASERGKWQGIMGAVFGLATVLGPLAGGWINDAFGWRWTFWMNVPLGVVALALIVTQLHLPFHPRKAKIDWYGAITFGGGLSALLLALSQGGRSHAWDSPYIIGLFAAATALLALFAFIEQRVEEPLIPLGLFRDRNVTTTTLTSLMIGAGMFAAIFYVPLFMQSVAGLSSADSGLALVPLMFGLIVTSTASGILISKTGTYKAIIVAGPALGALGLWLMSNLGADATIADTAWRVAIVGAGIGLVMQNAMLVAQNSVSLRDTGVITSVLTLARSVGGTVGIAVLGTVFASRLADDISKLDPKDAAAAQGIDSDSVLSAAESNLPEPIVNALQSAAAETLTHLFWLGIPFMLAALVATLLIRRDKLSDRTTVSVVDDLEHELADLVPIDANHASSVPAEPAEPIEPRA